MTTALLLASGFLLLGVGAALAVGRVLRSRSPWLRRVAAVVACLVTAYVAASAWAYVFQDRTALARAILWRDADTDDIARFPNRPIPAGEDPLDLSACPRGDDLDDLPVTRAGQGLEPTLEQSRSTAFLVLRGDCTFWSWYAAADLAGTPHTSFSVAKSFLSALVGIAIDRGEIESIRDPLVDYVPELRDRRGFADITLQDLLEMRSGLRYEEEGLPWSDDALTYYSPDLRATALSAEVMEEPGRWLYNNYNPLLVGLALERATGRRVATYMAEHLWQPMGAAQDASWSLDSETGGFEKMESGVNATPLDFARFGYLFAHEGVVEGRRVISRSWIATSTSFHSCTAMPEGYGYWWWLDAERSGRFLARGNLGQFVYVDPVTDVVVVRLGDDFGNVDWVPVLRTVADEVAGEHALRSAPAPAWSCD